MTLPAPLSLLQFSLRQKQRTGFGAVAGSRKAIASQLLAVSLIYALCLQCVLLPRVANYRYPRTSPRIKDSIPQENEEALG